KSRRSNTTQSRSTQHSSSHSSSSAIRSRSQGAGWRGVSQHLGAAPMGFDLAFALSSVPTILGAVGTTLFVALVSCIGAAATGFLFEMVRRVGGIAGLMIGFVIDFIRSTPVLAWLYFLYFVLPFYGIRLGSM